MTNEELQVHLKSGKVHGRPSYCVRLPADKLVCKDGFSLSVQASRTHYCSPKDDEGPYTHVEVWCCSQDPGFPDEYGDGDDPYAMVPIEVVLELINKHGGAT